MLTPFGARVGNLLYFWMRAHIASSSGREVRVREAESTEQWLALWPALNSLNVARAAIRRTDRHLDVPSLHFQQFGVDFTREQLDDFISSFLLSDGLAAIMEAPDPTALTVNVRRGDYYSRPDYRSRYGMDTDAYLRSAVAAHRLVSDIHRVVVVSDDPDWCTDNLHWLREIGPVDVRRESAVQNLATLASATNLILSNSTFSYWGGYLAGSKMTTCHVTVPRFHVADLNGGVAWQHDPSWHVIGAL